MIIMRPRKQSRESSLSDIDGPSTKRHASPKQDMSQGHSSLSLTREINRKSLRFYYDAGKKAMTTSTSSITKNDDTKHIEGMFSEFQRIRGQTVIWPEDGLAIGNMSLIISICISFFDFSNCFFF